MSGLHVAPPCTGELSAKPTEGALARAVRAPTVTALARRATSPAREGGTADRPAILAAARSWLGTPYQHQASLKGVGCDCLGLVRGVWREVVGSEPEPTPAYRADWAESGGAETLFLAARRWMTEIDPAAARPGDVLLFRMAADACVKHCAILSAAPTAADKHPRMIHAYWGRAVVESWVVPWWRSKIAAAFAFPRRADST